ncbi:hypothetical protein ASE04_18760 [Rhizobium sp. Root708]|nr:hypothetical protein ASE04_18760 [Rhizobium sp. Root708]
MLRQFVTNEFERLAGLASDFTHLILKRGYFPIWAKLPLSGADDFKFKPSGILPPGGLFRPPK